ncbi:MAG: YbfB/YjiJ family MFS transporter [Rhizobiaceae bacterium]|nr:YbfB/YjiJ family MFS transporter [Rhizobiaceae bacterium]MCV0405623.1 YbfB/YjiJ family MFS transporter [Rhizobiaceae bacterium]
MIAMTVAMGVSRFVYTPILPAMMEQLGLSAADAGMIASANYIGYLAGALLAAGGWAQGAERGWMLAGIGLSAVFAFAMAATDSLAAFLALRFLAGVASAFLMVFLGAIVFSQLAAAGRPDLQWLHFGGVGAGIAITGATVGLSNAAGLGWQAGWLWAGALNVAGFAAAWLMVDRGPAATGDAGREPPLPATRAMRGLTLAYGLFGFGYIVTATFLVAIVRQGDAGQALEGWVWIATGLAGFPSVWLWNRLVMRIGLTETFALACVVEAVGVTASVSMGGVAGPLIGGVLLGGTFIAITAFGLQAGRRLAGRSPRRALALMTAAFGLGQILGPLAAGFAADMTGSFLAPSMGAAAALVLAAAIALATARGKT